MTRPIYQSNWCTASAVWRKNTLTARCTVNQFWLFGNYFRGRTYQSPVVVWYDRVDNQSDLFCLQRACVEGKRINIAPRTQWYRPYQFDSIVDKINKRWHWSLIAMPQLSNSHQSLDLNMLSISSPSGYPSIKYNYTLHYKWYSGAKTYLANTMDNVRSRCRVSLLDFRLL